MMKVGPGFAGSLTSTCSSLWSLRSRSAGSILDGRRALALFPEQSHNDENGNHRPREPVLIASDLKRLATVVFPPPFEPHNDVGQQKEDHHGYEDRNRHHRQGELEDRL